MAFNVSLQGPSTFELSTSSSISIRTAKLTAADRARVPFTAEIGTPIPIVDFKDLAISSSTVVADRKILGKFTHCRRSNRSNPSISRARVRIAFWPGFKRQRGERGRTVEPVAGLSTLAKHIRVGVLTQRLVKYLLRSRSRRFTRAVETNRVGPRTSKKPLLFVYRLFSDCVP